MFSKQVDLTVPVDDLIVSGHHYCGGVFTKISLANKVIEREIIRTFLFKGVSKNPFIVTLNPDLAQEVVYFIINVYSGEFYVGSSGNGFRRTKDHRNRLSANIHVNDRLQKSFNQFGKAVFDICYIFCESKTESLDVEQFFLDKLHSLPDCMNVSLDSRRAQLGRAMTEAQIASIVRYNENRIFTDELREKLSLAQKSSPKAIASFEKARSKRKKPITVGGVRYESVRAAARTLGVHKDTVYRRVQKEERSGALV